MIEPVPLVSKLTHSSPLPSTLLFHKNSFAAGAALPLSSKAL